MTRPFTPPQGTPSVKEEILTKLDVDTYVDTFYFRADWDSQDEVKEYLMGLLDRYAMAVVLASVPEEDGNCYPERESWNDCRLATLTKAREMTNQ